MGVQVEKIQDVTAVVLAGGRSKRMGTDKALIRYQGHTLLERQVANMQRLFTHVLVAGGDPARYPHAPAPVVPDVLPSGGSIVGLHAGLSAATTDRIFAVACDIPFPQEQLIRFLVEAAPDADWVVPQTAKGLQPLFALYSQRCRPAIEAIVATGDMRIQRLDDHIETARIAEVDLRRHDPALRSFININTPDDFNSLPLTSI